MRKAGIVILVLLAISVVLFVVDLVTGLGLIKGGVTWLLTPLQRGISTETPQVGSFWERWRDAGQLQEKNRQLQELVDELKAKEIRYREIEREYQALRQLLGLHERFPDLILLDADVIGRDPSSTRQVLRIGWIQSEGVTATVQVGMPVISAAGLVGRIIEVYPSSADVLLITDIGSSVSAVVQNDARPTGIVEGRWQAGSRLLMRYIPQGDAVNVDDWVVTAGLEMPPFEAEAFPPGIPIGQVLHLEISADMHQQAELLPAVDLDHLDRVMIVLGTR